MPLLNLTFRHLIRHWRLNLVVLLCLTLATALLASLPSYAVAVAARELEQNLAEASPAERNLLITGDRYTFTSDLYEHLQEKLEDFLKDRLIVRYVTLTADPLLLTEQTGQKRKRVSLLDLYSFDKLPNSVRLIEGRLPTQVQMRETSPQRPPPVEAVIGARAAEQSGYGVSDRLTADREYYRLDIVGIVEPLDPHDDMWEGDLSAFNIAVDTSDPNVDTNKLSLIIAAESMRSYFRFVPLFLHEVFWRVTLNHNLISVDNAEALHSDLINIQTQFGTKGATTSSGLVRILADYLAQLSRVRMTLFLLTAQAFIFVLYTLTMLTSFILDRSQIELATLSGRGSSAWQIMRIFALENLILVLPAALLLGPSLAQGALRLWAKSNSGITLRAMPPESWLLSGVAAGLGWLALILPVYPAARQDILEWEQRRARPAQLSLIQKLYLDLFLLVFGGLFYWQLDRAGSFVMRRLGDSLVADPLLLMGPTLLLVAIAMIFLRLFPFLLRLVAWAFQRLRGLMLPLGLNRLARDPLKPSHVVLLISLATGLILFTNTFKDSLFYSQEEMAHYMAGADLRVALAETDQSTQQLALLPGVLSAAPVFRGRVRTEDGQMIQLLAVHPATFAQVARYPVSLTQLEIGTVMQTIQSEAGTDVLPAILSPSALPTGKNVGDQLSLNFAGRQLLYSVQGIISNFPTLSGPFVILSLPDLEAKLDLDSLGRLLSGSREAWLAVDPAQHEELVQHPMLKEHILEDAQAHLHVLQRDTLAQGTSGALELNTLTLALLSVTAFMLVHFFAAQQRVLEFSVMRAMGLSVRQLLTLLVTEGVLVMGLGLVAGTIIGYGLSRVMIPYLSQALSGALAGITIKQIIVDWSSVARLYMLLIAFYGLALLLLLLVLVRVGVHQALRMGDE